MLQEDHKRRVARLIRGERKVADLHNLFSDLRMHQPGRATVQEIGHFAAHRHERDKGISLTRANRSEEHTSELQSLMRISYAVFCLKKKKLTKNQSYENIIKKKKK